jgi:hypothetical protein
MGATHFQMRTLKHVGTELALGMHYSYPLLK